jgi:lambda family phage portal protein
MSRSTGLVHANGRPISRGEVHRARAGAIASLGYANANEGARKDGTFLTTWRPGLRSADADWLVDRNDVVARSRDVGRNDVVGASAGARKVNSAVGFRWRLSAKPSARALGISPEAAHELGRQFEAHFHPYAYGVLFQSDAERQVTFGQQLRQSASHICYDGEALGLVEWAAGETTPFRTRLRMVDPDRLSNPNGEPDSPTLRGGVQRNAAGVRELAWIREGHPSDVGANLNSMTWRAWPFHSTPLGRPQVLHAYDKLRAGESRGRTRFAAALKSFRALSKFTDATLEVATLNAMFLGFVKSNAGLSAVSDSFETSDLIAFQDEREDWYKENPIAIDGVQLPVLGVDDEVDLKTGTRDTTGFDSFVRAILRLIAAGLGLTYEELSMDFSQTNYSSARAAMLIAWNETLALRGLIEAQIARPFYVAWLEEAFDRGTFELPAGAPDFYDAVDAYSECRWIGPARGYVDPTKEVDAAAARIEMRKSTLEKECAEDGEDWEEVLEQTAREQAKKRELGIESDAAALARVAATARSPEHSQALDQRGAA